MTVQPLLFEEIGVYPIKAAGTKAKRKRRPKPTVADDAPVSYETSIDGDGVRMWVLRFPAPTRMLSANSRPYWRLARANAKQWREAMFVHARAAKLPVGLRKVSVDISLRFPTAARHDSGNYYATVGKPIVDAVGPQRTQTVKKGPRAGQTVVEVGHGLIPDDTPEFLDGPFITIGPKVDDPRRCPFGEVTVTITDLSAEVAA